MKSTIPKWDGAFTVFTPTPLQNGVTNRYPISQKTHTKTTKNDTFHYRFFEEIHVRFRPFFSSDFHLRRSFSTSILTVLSPKWSILNKNRFVISGRFPLRTTQIEKIVLQTRFTVYGWRPAAPRSTPWFLQPVTQVIVASKPPLTALLCPDFGCRLLYWTSWHRLSTVNRQFHLQAVFHQPNRLKKNYITLIITLILIIIYIIFFKFI